MEPTEKRPKETATAPPVTAPPVMAPPVIAPGDWLRAFVDSSDDAILSLDLDGRIRTWNPAAEAMFQYSAEEIVGRSIFVLVPLGYGNQVQESLRKAGLGMFLNRRETVRMKRDGTRFEVALSVSSIRDGAGRVVGIGWIVRDISLRRRREALIRKLSQVVEQTADSVMITDRSGRVEYVNPAFTEQSGYSPQEMIGGSPAKLKSGKHPPELYRELWARILSGRPYRNRLVNRRKDGAFYETEKTITPLFDEAGQITHFVSTDKDMTARLRDEPGLAAPADAAASVP